MGITLAPPPLARHPAPLLARRLRFGRRTLQHSPGLAMYFEESLQRLLLLGHKHIVQHLAVVIFYRLIIHIAVDRRQEYGLGSRHGRG